jgi:hypothetical protein
VSYSRALLAVHRPPRKQLQTLPRNFLPYFSSHMRQRPDIETRAVLILASLTVLRLGRNMARNSRVVIETAF